MRDGTDDSPGDRAEARQECCQGSHERHVPTARTLADRRALGILRLGYASIDAMLDERRIRTRTPEWRTIFDRIQVAMDLTSRLNVLPFSDANSRDELLTELLGRPMPERAIIMPPFYCTYGLGIELGERVSVGQACSFLDLGGITIGERTMISPKVTLVTEGHPIDPAERFDFITVAPIVIEANVWIGAAATILPGVTIGHDSVVGAGAVVAKDVPALTVVTGAGYIERRRLAPAPHVEN
jgi:acetyltransferase-like isoleucine patch superfamily enzyme